MRQEMMFVDGEWTKGSSEESIDVINPATEEKISTVPRLRCFSCSVICMMISTPWQKRRL